MLLHYVKSESLTSEYPNSDSKKYWKWDMSWLRDDRKLRAVGSILYRIMGENLMVSHRRLGFSIFIVYYTKENLKILVKINKNVAR